MNFWNAILLNLSFVLLPATACAQEIDSSWLLKSPIARLLPAEVIMDNSEGGTLHPKVPGAIFSGGDFQKGFGVIFKPGPSIYVLKSLDVLISSFPQEPAFEGDLAVNLYAMGEGLSTPEASEFSRVFHGINFPAREGYVSLDLKGAELRSGVRYALVVSAPNSFKAQIFGHQVPDVAPSSKFGFTSESGIWGSPEEGWRPQLHPLVHLRGWDLRNDFAREVTQGTTALLGCILLILLGLLIFYWRYKQ